MNASVCPKLRSTIIKFGGNQTLMRTCNVITWNSFVALKAHPIYDLLIEVALVYL
jgi:hypothetical protein